MPHFRSFEKLDFNSVWVTIGSFDGVHLGHQHLIKKMADEAHAVGSQAVVITFFPHPAMVLRGLNTPYYLSDLEEKADLLLKLGVDAVFTIPFTHELSALSALEFMQMIKNYINLTHLWVGYDFALGRNRSGDIPALTRIGLDLQYDVNIFQPVQINGITISSRQIRELLKEGLVDQAATLLGRFYSVNGKVVHGDGRGRLLGIPTTNLAYFPWRLLPRPGVYATLAHVGDSVCRAVTNIGTNPTFIDPPFQTLRLETHILDYSGDLYDTEQSVDFCKFIRPEEKYDSVQKLKDRIDLDILFARQNLPPV